MPKRSCSSLAGVVALAALAALSPQRAESQAGSPVFLDQGPNWTELTRADFYTRDQGSRIMPVAWMRALKQPNGQPFLADTLGRYGYLPNPLGSDSLPVGFTVSGPGGAQVIGMTCAACHTRQITVQDTSYRIDGGPALSDFQGFLTDLDTAVAAVLHDDAAFNPFAAAVLTPTGTTAADTQALKDDVKAWYDRYHALTSRALPPAPWGVGRLDAIGMIFDRLTGLDLGPETKGYVIAENIHPADAPVRYPFLWNAPIQDKTQWPGFADNGNDILGLARNLGEVYGVFGAFAPHRAGLLGVLNVDYSSNNSANFDGLNRLEFLIRQVAPPKWPWAIDADRAAKGRVVFERSTAEGGCAECHAIRPGILRPFSSGTWATPVQDVGTDSHEYAAFNWDAKTGSLKGALVPFVGLPLQGSEKAVKVLKTAVLGSIIQHYIEFFTPVTSSLRKAVPGLHGFVPGRLGSAPMPPEIKALEGAFGPAGAQGLAKAVRKDFLYEARVMQGIWAVAPYLHNGSVPSLAELLKPASERIATFKVGPAYDVVNVGIAADQAALSSVMTTTDCAKRDSGNSNCGHEFGTHLPAEEKAQLLEYLKTL